MSPSSSGSQDSSSWSPASISLVVMTCVVFLVCSYHMIFKRILETIPVQTPWRNGHSLSALTRLLEIPYPSSQQSQLGGLCTSILKTLPVTQYANEGEVKETECVVCLGEFNKGEWTRYLPDCGHRFHVACIDGWFQGHSSCPTCRARVGWRKTALETLSREAFVQERAMSYQDFRLQIFHSMIIDIGTQTNFE